MLNIPKHAAWLVPVAALLAFLLWLKRRKANFYVDGVSGADDTGYVVPKIAADAEAFKAVIPALISKYGQERAEIVERMYRWETAHFTSQQYQSTNTPGMEAHGIAPTYGWYVPFFMVNPSYMPIGTQNMTENGTGKEKRFVVMPSVEAGAMFLADYIGRYNGDYARWYSTNEASKANYRSKIMSVVPRFARGIA